MTQSEPRIPGYAKVRLAPRVFRVIHISRETDKVVIGYRVDPKTGERWYSETAKAVTEEVVACTPACIVQRLVMNTRYAELEPA